MKSIYTQNSKELFNNELGYTKLKVFDNHELNEIKKHIIFIYRNRLKSFLNKNLHNQNIENYHNLNISNEDHIKLWVREKRKADNKLTNYIKNTKLFLKLKKDLKKLDFSYVVDRHINSEPDIYWRLVRPGMKDDVGSIHADSWFWKLNNYPIKQNTKTFKIWCMLSEGEINSGLDVIEGSHRDIYNWKYTTEERNKTIRPKFDMINNKFSLKKIMTKYGEGIIFNEDLLHCGSVNKFNETRVSIEFTLLYEVE